MLSIMVGGARRGTRRVPSVLAATGMAVSAVLASAAASRADDQTLPRIPGTLTSAACTRPSAKTTALTPWQQTALRPSGAWTVSQGAGVTVAVVDTGVDASGTPELAGRVTAGPDTATGRAHAAGSDCVGHGTFVAGLIAAGPAGPDDRFAGVAPQARVFAVRVTDASGAATADHVAAGIDAAVAGGAGVVDVPIALAAGSPALTSAVAAAVRHDVLVVAPAYAEQSDDTAPAPAAYPAALPGVLAVAALTPDGAADQAEAPATAPDLAAPGQSVMSVGPGGSGYFTGTGADFASAMVAGTAALVDAAEPGLTAGELTERLERSAVHAAGSGSDPLVGWGTVDPAAAVSAVLPGSGTSASSPSGASSLSGASSPSSPSGAARSLRMAAPVRHTGMRQAWVVAGGAAGLSLLVALVAVVVPRGRRRGWRPGTGPAAEAPAGPPALGGDAPAEPDDTAVPLVAEAPEPSAVS
ncbi:S8 family serine peptidase [Actinacidiphila yeochonensis]|uniref:S8 family serine peptidase n=1 Tax=Actinacidiphila yeochonensis TaxID=89050 RepID=UPI00068F0CDF|nr:S8 family serine peptidase [Actinacidiphila yeochonensis]